MQPLWRTVWKFLIKLKIELPYDPAISFLGIYLEKTTSQKDTCTPMFIAALFTIAKTWKQPKYPLTEEKRRCSTYKQWDIIHKKEWNNAICSNMNGPRDYHTKWSMSNRERQISYDVAYMWNLKKWYNWTYLQNRNRVTDVENNLMVTGGKEREE